jgi:hypothetical protein
MQCIRPDKCQIGGNRVLIGEKSRISKDPIESVHHRERRAIQMNQLLVMCPHPQNLHGLGINNLINNPMLDVDSSRECPRQIANQFFVGWILCKWIFSDCIKNFLSFLFKI